MSRPRVEQLYPLSPAQRGLFAQELGDPSAGHYIVQLVATLHGALDRHAFEEAWRVVQSRHDALRSSFVWESVAEPLQVVHREAPLPLTWMTASGDGWLDRFLARQRTEGIPLRRAPLFSVTVAQVDDRRWHLVWCYHHLLLDGWSSAIVLRELLTAYAAIAGGARPTLPTPGRYDRYVSWLQSQDLSAAARFWRDHLAGAPAGRVRRSTETAAPGSCARLISPQLQEGIDAFLRRERVTTATLVHGAWALLLARRTGVGDLTMGSVVAGRPETLEGADQIVGALINILPIRVRLAPEQAVGEWLRLLQRNLHEARRHGAVPISRIAQWVGHAGMSLFDTLLTVENYPDAPWQGGSSDAPLQIEQVRLIESTDYPLTLEAVPAQRLLLQVLFDRQQLPADGVEQLLADAETLLERLTTPDLRLGAVLRPAMRGASVRNRSADGTLVTRFAEASARHAGAIAVECDGAALTYAELSERAARIRAALVRAGLGSEDRVLLLLDRSPDLVAAMLAVLQAGGCYVPVDLSTPADRVSLLLADAGARLVVTVSSVASRVAGADCLLLDRLPPDDGSLPSPEPVVHPDQAAYVIYTSGSTGRPKGVVVSHRNVIRLFDATSRWLGAGPGDVWTMFHSCAFDFSVWEIFGALLHGGRVVVVPWVTSRSPEDFAALLADRGVTVLSQTPSAFRLLASHLAASRTPRLEALRLVVFGGEALPFDVLAPFVARYGQRPRIVNMYGITETSVHVTERPVDPVDTVLVQGSHIGVPLDDLGVRLLDEEGEPVPDGEPGEIGVAGPGLARGYLGDPRLTAQRFVPDPAADVPGTRLYRSGDLARRLPNGDLEYLGRADRQVKVRGYRIEPGEVEAALRLHPAVEDAVVALQHEGDDTVLVAHVVPAVPGAEPVRRLVEAAASRPGRAMCELPNGVAVFHQQASATQMMYDEIFTGGSYLRHGVTIADGDCVFDVGANIGLFSLLAHVTARDVRVFAFEPMTEVFELLEANRRCHGIAGQALPVAIGAREGQETLTYFPNVSVVSGTGVDLAAQRAIVASYLRHQHGASLEQADLDALLEDRMTTRPVTCTVRRLSDVRRSLGVERIDLLKIDVEGGEEAVLDGIDAEDWPRIRQVVLEAHGDATRERVVARLAALGFTTVAEQQQALRDAGMWTVYAASRAVGPASPSAQAAPYVWRSPLRLMQALRAHLESCLPSHMIPHALAPIGQLPLTANGKIDLRALPHVRPATAGPRGDDRVPASDAERVLSAIWRELLAVPGVALDDSFFELGGDSILAVQLVARARREGLRITPAQVFEQRTLERLAAVARPLVRPASAEAAGGRPRVGRVPLTPAQRWFFAQQVPNRSHWNQAVLFEIPSLPPAALDAGLRAALRAHDVFALRFTRGDEGWRQEYATSDETGPLLDVCPAGSEQDTIERLHRSLDIGRGPLLRAALIAGADGGRPRLLLVAHHLVVDAVSWRILVEDIVTAARDAAEGRMPVVHPPAVSFGDWAAWLARAAAGDAGARQAGAYLAQLRRSTPRLPRDREAAVPAERTSATVSRVLSPPETVVLHERLARSAGMNAGHVVLAAVTAGLSQWMGGAAVRVDLESHGRDTSRALDTSRTVGWFTGIWPVVLPVGEATDIPALLRMVKEAVGDAPHAGLGYGMLRYLAPEETRAAWAALPDAEVIFNFHGRVDGGSTSGDAVRLLETTVGPLHDPDALRTHLVIVEASVDARGLAIEWSYSQAVHDASTIERLASTTMATLRRMLALASYDRVLAPVASDYPLARLEADELARIVAQFPDLEDVYPLSPAQQGIFFHALFDPSSTVYFTQFHWTIEGDLDVDAFWRGWAQAVSRHAVLRTAFLHRGLREPLQVVRGHVTVPTEYHDWRASSGPSDDAWAWFLARQRAMPFDMESPPLMRLALVRIDDRRHRFVWNHHHILFDGWCTGLILSDVFAAYEAIAAGHAVPDALAAPAPAYRAYIEWLSRQESGAAAAFWRAHLAGWEAVSLPSGPGAGETGEDPLPAFELEPETDRRLRALSRGAITLNTIVVGAWALVLSATTGSDRVLVGSTTAGRPTDLEEAEHTVGLFVSTLPVPVQVERDARVIDWLGRLQAFQVEARTFEHVSLSQIQRWCAPAGAGSLIDTAVVFENLPASSLRRRSPAGLGITDVGSFVRNHFTLTIRAVPHAPLRLEALFDPARVTRPAVMALLDALQLVLRRIADAPEHRVASLIGTLAADGLLPVARG